VHTLIIFLLIHFLRYSCWKFSAWIRDCHLNRIRYGYDEWAHTKTCFLCISGTQIYYGIQLQLASMRWASVPWVKSVDRIDPWLNPGTELLFRCRSPPLIWPKFADKLADIALPRQDPQVSNQQQDLVKIGPWFPQVSSLRLYRLTQAD
jgi:hypothetical protein